jgi:uncharacterized protein
MNPDLEGLVRLQQVESDIRRIQAQLAQVPKRKAELEAALAAERARLEAARQALDGSQKSRRRYEGELQDLETKRSRYKGQLMEVKTNKEYTAMLHEIEGVEREIRGREDQILGEMEKAEALVAEVKREEELTKVAQDKHRSEVATLDQEAGRLGQEADRLGREREQVASRIPTEALELFQRVARVRGVAVAEAKDGMCQLCHLKLRPQMYVDLKHNEVITQCPACNRILFYTPDVPTVSFEP